MKTQKKGWSPSLLFFYIYITIYSLILLINGGGLISAGIVAVGLVLWLAMEVREQKRKEPVVVYNLIEKIFMIYMLAFVVLTTFNIEYRWLWSRYLYCFLFGGAVGSRVYIIGMYYKSRKDRQKKKN